VRRERGLSRCGRSDDGDETWALGYRRHGTAELGRLR
jgi:hypothetical protein